MEAAIPAPRVVDVPSKPAFINGVAEDGTLLADAGQGNQRFSSAEISLRGQE
jgi:hypothetical protein